MTKLSCHAGSKAERGSVIPAELDLFQAFSGPDTFEDAQNEYGAKQFVIRLELRRTLCAFRPRDTPGRRRSLLRPHREAGRDAPELLAFWSI